MKIQSINAGKSGVKTPCVGLCSTVYGDLVCRGCKRFHHEVTHWNIYQEEEKRAVLGRLEALLAQVVAGRFEVLDPALLEQQLIRYGVPYIAEQSPYCWVYLLLVKGGRQIRSLSAYGLALRPETPTGNLAALRDAIDADFMRLSMAYYERYLMPSISLPRA